MATSPQAVKHRHSFISSSPSLISLHLVLHIYIYIYIYIFFFFLGSIHLKFSIMWVCVCVCVCDFERENHRSDICVCDFYVYVCDRVWICVCVCDFGPKNHKSKFVFLILGLAGHERKGPTGARRGGFRVEKKIRLIKGPDPSFQDRPAGQV